MPSPADPSDAASLPRSWSAHWEAEGERPVLLVTGGGTADWIGGAQAAAATAGAAARLAAHGIAAGSRVVWSAQRSAPSVLSALGVLRLGAVLVPVNPAWSEAELGHVLGDVEPAGVLCGAEPLRAHLGALEHLGAYPVLDPGVVAGTEARVPPLPVLDVAEGGDPALIVYTSGTTGRPKGAVLTHANLVAGTAALHEAWRWTGDDRLTLALPLFHVHGLVAGLFGALATGGSVVVHPRFDPDAVLASGERHGATLFFGVPTMYHRLLGAPGVERLSGLRLCVSGSAPLSEALFAEVARRAGVAVLERYGMTETLLTVSNPYEGPRRPGTVGLPLPGVRIELRPDGELAVAGPTVFAGYWRQPVATAACRDGEWLLTGDLARFDDHGYLVIQGRSKDLIISGGFNVYPAEVEDALVRHPAVAEAAVTGAPSEEWGETVVAWVVADGTPPEPGELITFVGERLAPYKRPREVRFVESLPRNALGKLQRQELTGRPAPPAPPGGGAAG